MAAIPACSTGVSRRMAHISRGLLPSGGLQAAAEADCAMDCAPTQEPTSAQRYLFDMQVRRTLELPAAAVQCHAWQ